jgi:hypothetical protein
VAVGRRELGERRPLGGGEHVVVEAGGVDRDALDVDADGLPEGERDEREITGAGEAELDAGGTARELRLPVVGGAAAPAAVDEAQGARIRPDGRGEQDAGAGMGGGEAPSGAGDAEAAGAGALGVVEQVLGAGEIRVHPPDLDLARAEGREGDVDAAH